MIISPLYFYSSVYPLDPFCKIFGNPLPNLPYTSYICAVKTKYLDIKCTEAIPVVS